MLIRIEIKDQDIDITAFLFFSLVDAFSYSILHQEALEIKASIDQCVEMILRYTNIK